MIRRGLFSWSGAVWTTAASLGILCALVVGAQARDKKQGSISDGSAQQNGQTLQSVGDAGAPGERVTFGALPACADAMSPDCDGTCALNNICIDQAGTCGCSPCNANSCVDTDMSGTVNAGDVCTFTKSLNTLYDDRNIVAYINGDYTAANSWAQYVDPAEIAGFGFQTFTIQNVKFGARQATVNDIPIRLTLYRDFDLDPAAGLLELCSEELLVDMNQVGTPIPCDDDLDCTSLGDPTSTTYCGCESNDDCDLATGDPDATCDVGTGICPDIGALVCMGISNIVPITVPFGGASAPVLPGGRKMFVVLSSYTDGGDATPPFEFRPSGSVGNGCGPTYLLGGDGLWDTMDDLNGNAEAGDLYLQVTGVVGGAAAVCGNGTLQGCEECDPSTACPLGLGEPCCDADCTFVDCGDPAAGDCCDPAGHNNPRCGSCTPNPAGDAAACCQQVCDTDPFCCDTNGGNWDDVCAATAADPDVGLCIGAGDCCKVVKLIATCPAGNVDNIEGCLVLGADEWGAVFDAEQFGGQGGDTYNPIGAAAASVATFGSLLEIYIGNDKREALSDPTDDQHGLTEDDSCETVATISPLVLSDTTPVDLQPDTSMSAFDVTCTGGVNLSFQLESHVETLNGFGAVGALLTQEYIVTNNTASPIDFTLVKHMDMDLVWDAGADFTDDSVGTMTNGSPCGKFVSVKETDVAGTAITVSSPQATRYYASKGYSSTAGVLNPNNLAIDGPQEPTNSSGTGTGTVTLDPTTLAFGWSVSYSGLGSNATAAHFHGPAGCAGGPCMPGACPAGQACVSNACVDCSGFPGSTAPPITPPGNLGPPAATSGMFSGGPVTITTSQAGEVTGGEWYLNIHSSGFLGGEIRGQTGPTWGFGTDLQQFEQRGVPIPWRNRVPVVGLNTNGFSGDLAADTNCDPCDASMGLEIPVCLGANETKTFVVYLTYGSETPGGVACQAPSPLCVTVSCPGCVGDFNGNGTVNAADLALLLGAWGPGCSQANGCCMDINNSGSVNAADLALLLGNWGPC